MATTSKAERSFFTFHRPGKGPIHVNLDTLTRVEELGGGFHLFSDGGSVRVQCADDVSASFRKALGLPEASK